MDDWLRNIEFKFPPLKFLFFSYISSSLVVSSSWFSFFYINSLFLASILVLHQLVPEWVAFLANNNFVSKDHSHKPQTGISYHQLMSPLLPTRHCMRHIVMFSSTLPCHFLQKVTMSKNSLMLQWISIRSSSTHYRNQWIAYSSRLIPLTVALHLKCQGFPSPIIAKITLSTKAVLFIGHHLYSPQPKPHIFPSFLRNPEPLQPFFAWWRRMIRKSPFQGFQKGTIWLLKLPTL